MQANAKIERVTTKKLDDLFHLKRAFSDKSGLGYTGGSSTSGNITKEVKFIKAKESTDVGLIVEKPKIEEKRNVGNEWLLKPRNQSVGRSES